MILLNFDFIYSELMENTIHYLINEEEKKSLVNEGEQRGFNGRGFKNKTRLLEYMYEKGFLNEKEFIKKIESSSRRTNHETIKKLYTLFKKDTPLFIDTEKLYRLMLLSSNLMFKPNDKICFTIILANPYEYWTAEQIVQSANHNNTLPLSKGKIEQRLNCYVDGENPIIISQNNTGEMQYALNITNFIYYITQFDKKK
ncbi:hypothetical protein BBI11_08985 [Planococcus maritimus]|uniref:hypothetical protein n=1 Tax=Planococcus maritimus TaxID=192421 RepID=UPI00080EEA01|nr:hypothetical protein [Planococcus maritimus]ANU17141.1 hypothetical protein BBI11_08985 [Planococcus maritimus]